MFRQVSKERHKRPTIRESKRESEKENDQNQAARVKNEKAEGLLLDAH